MLRGEVLEPRLPLALGDLLATLNNPSTNPQANEQAGTSVAIDGGYTVVGVPYADVSGVKDAGAAYVYDSSTGALLRTLSNPSPSDNDDFGSSVAVSGNTIVVAAVQDNFGLGTPFVGVVYAFDATTGNLLRTFTSPAQGGGVFGSSVAVSGTNVVVGDYLASNQGHSTGLAYTFDLTTGSRTHTLIPPTSQADEFGYSVAVAGNTVVVGSVDDFSFAPGAGAAYVYDVTTGGLLRTLASPSPAASEHFGNAVAIAGGTIVVGASDSTKFASDGGAAYVFDAASGNFVRSLGAPAPSGSDHFGSSVAMSGSTIVVGADNAKTGTTSNFGLAYSFDAVTGNLIQTFSDSTPTNLEQFGASVGVSGTKIVVGAPVRDGQATDSGGAFIFDSSGTLLKSLTNPLPADDERLGWAVATAGNIVVAGVSPKFARPDAAYVYDATSGSFLRPLVNPGTCSGNFGGAVAASASLIVVGAPSACPAGITAGLAYLFDPATGNLLRTLTNPTPASSDSFGASVAINGNTIVVGAPGDDTGAANAGSSYVFDATTGNLLRSINNPAPAAGDGFGNAVAISGNTVVVGASADDAGATDSGTAYVFDASTGNLLRTLNNPTPNTTDNFGRSVAVWGTRAVVGATGDDTIAANAGAAYLFDTLTGNLARTITDPAGQFNDSFGISVGISGSTIVGGAWFDDTGAASAGSAYIFDAFTGSVMRTLSNPTPAMNENFGQAVAVSDKAIVVGTPGEDGSAVDRGAAYVYGGENTTTIYLDIGGNLNVSDGLTGGKSDHWKVSFDGAKYTIQDTSSPVANLFTTIGLSGVTGSGTSSVTIPAASIPGNRLIFNTGDGNDSLTIDLSGGNPIRSGGLTINGGNPLTAPADTLLIIGGSEGAVTYNGLNASDGSIVMSSLGTINYTGLEAIVNSGAASDVTFNLPPGANVAALGDDGTTGNTLSRLSGATLLTTDFANPSGTLTINRGNATDAITVGTLPDLSAGLKIGTAASPFATITFAGAVTLASGKNLSTASTSLNVSGGLANLTLAGSGLASITGDNVDLSTAGTLAAPTVSIQSLTAGRPISLGSEASGQLSLTDAELDHVAAGTIQIGDAGSGAIVVSADVTRTSGTTLSLVSGGAINITAGLVDTGGGNLTLSPGGAASVGVAKTGIDASLGASGTLGFASGSDLAIAINGLTADTQYDQLNVVGKIDLTGVDLVLTGTLLPTMGDTFEIVNNDGADAVVGTFNGLSEGKAFTVPVGSASRAFQITYQGGDGNDVVLTAINATPTLDAIADPAAILEGAGQQTIALSGISAGGSETQGLTVTAVSDNPTLIPSPSVSYTSPGPTGSLTYTPQGKQSGTAVITVTVKDDGGTAHGAVDTTTRTFTVTVTPVNDAPTLDAIADPAAILEDATAQTINLTGVSAGPSESQTLTITATSSNPALLANPTVTYSSPNATGSLSYAPLANQSGTAVITVKVQDNGGTANGGVDTITRTFTVAVTPVADAPIGANKTLTTNEDTPLVFGSSAFGFSDPNDNPADQFMGVKIASLPANGALQLDGQAVHVGDFVLFADLTSGGLKFVPAVNGNGPAYAAFTFQVQDSGNINTGGSNLDSVPRTMTIDVTSVNDAPNGASSTISLPEDIEYTFSVSDFGFSDAADQSPPSSQPPNTLLNVIVAALPASGQLYNNGVPLTVNQIPWIISKADITANRLVFRPAANMNGTATFTFQVQDNGGTANFGLDTDPSPNTITLFVQSVNDAPVGAGGSAGVSVGTIEDQPYTFTVGDFGFTDPNDNPADNFLNLRIVSGPAKGTLLNSNQPIGGNAVVARASIAAGSLVFVPASNGNGVSPGYDSFTFKVQDDGGALAGGQDTDVTARTMSISVTPVNDAPTGADKTIALNEDATYSFSTADFAFSDAADASPPSSLPPNAFANVILTTPAAAAGTVKLAGVAQAPATQITLPVNQLTQFTFIPPANTNSANSPSPTIAFQVQDNGSSLNGGQNTSSPASTITFNVAPVNDPPQGQDHTINLVEDQIGTLSALDFGFSDAGDAPPNVFTNVLIVSAPAHGTLSINEIPVAANSVISVADITAGRLKFIPAANSFGVSPPYDRFTFKVEDDGGTANGGVDTDPVARTMTFTVASLNDPPQGIDGAVSTLEDTDYVFGPSDFSFTDPNDSPANGLLAVKITGLPAAGSLKLDGSDVLPGQLISRTSLVIGQLVYTPAADANGPITLTFQVQDSGGTANGGVDLDPTANTLTINLQPVNDAPSFVKGIDKNATDESGAVSFAGWASAIVAGPANEAAQHLHFVVQTNTNTSLFAAGPAIDAAGKLTFTPKANVAGSAQVTIALVDDGGTASGGSDTSPPQTFAINITKPRRWHNTTNGLDVNADGHVVAGDALAVINQINAFGAGPVPPGATIGPPFYDVNGDGSIAPNDALAVINQINAFGSGEGEGTGDRGQEALSEADLLDLLAADLAGQPRRRQLGEG